MVEISSNLDPRMNAAAERALDNQRVQAGKEYLDALNRLGLDPDVLCWVYDVDADEMELAIVTTMAERVEILQIYKLLFRAYEVAATPREIDPFIVSIYGSNSNHGIQLRDHVSTLAADGAFSSPENAKRFVISQKNWSENLVILARGIYTAKQVRRSATEDMTRWNRFRKNVQSLAA